MEDGFISAGSGWREVGTEWSELQSGYWMIRYLKPSRVVPQVWVTLGKIFFWAPC